MICWSLSWWFAEVSVDGSSEVSVDGLSEVSVDDLLKSQLMVSWDVSLTKLDSLSLKLEIVEIFLEFQFQSGIEIPNWKFEKYFWDFWNVIFDNLETYC